MGMKRFDPLNQCWIVMDNIATFHISATLDNTIIIIIIIIIINFKK